MKTTTLLGGLSVSALVLAAVGAAPVQPPQTPATATAPATQPHPATSADLGGATRYLTFLATDKPIYRANDKLFARAILLNAATHQPLGANESANAQIQILGPKGEIVASGMAQSQDSIVGFNWTVPPEAAGGEYTLKVNYPWQGYAPAERKFDVRIYRAPRLRSQITFLRDGYGPGDKVTASLHTERAEGGFPAGAKITITARVDDTQVYVGSATVDATGAAKATFDLPKVMARGEGTLAFAIEDGGTVETAAKTIPILLQTLDLAIYPEGGDAVVGVNNRYYIEARTPAKKPADLVGEIDDSHGKKVADVKTEHEGRGRFNFTPAKGEAYTLKLSQPAGISKTWTLPAAKAGGVVIRTLEDVVGKDQPVRVQIIGKPAKVTLTQRERDVVESEQRASDKEGVAAYTFVPKTGADGVLTLTVWSDKGIPLAERLIYRQPAHSVNVQIAPSQSTYAPGGKASINLTTTDESGKPISALVGLTVTDDSLLEMIEKREQAPRLPVMVLLEPEVRDLADAHVYLDPNNPNAARDVDLLLGTQGWRRFALYNTTEFLSKYGEDAKRALAFLTPPQPMAFGAGFGGGGFAFDGVNRDAAQLGVMLMPQGAAAHAAIPAAPPGAINHVLADDRKAVLAKEEVAQLDKDLEMPKAAADLAAERQVGAGARAERRLMPAGGSFVVVRQYAHDLRPNWSPNDRSDFTETLYWNAGIKTDDSGHGSASFNLSDSVSTFRIFADSFSGSGALGASSKTIQSVQPFYVEAKMPLEVTAGDVIQLPITAINNLPKDIEGFSLTVNAAQSLKIESANQVQNTMAAGQRRRLIYTIAPDTPGDYDLTINASLGRYSDKVTRKLRVRPKGFPTSIAYGGLLDKDSAVSKQFTIPASMVPSSMQTIVSVYPSPLANLTDAVAALMREPCGCFEQTSSSNYPLAMAQQYFINHQGIDPKLITQASVLLDHGYQRLIGFECKDKGYEWFGGEAPGHEALTAYGLMEFRDMQAAKLAIVDDQMVERTRVWLLSRRDGKGGFQRNARALDSFGGAPELTTNAYIVWALLQAGEKNLDPEITAVREAAKTSTDSYVLALAANICNLAKDDTTAHDFMDKLVRKQNKDGAVDGAGTSITRSGGQALAIETTSLASLAWESDAKTYAANNQNAIKYLADSCKGGRFGSTQSTILALKAITAYDTANAHPKASGEVTLLLDSRPLGDPVQFTADTKEPLKFPDLAGKLTPGDHTVALQMTAGSEMPFSMAFNYNSVTPATDKQCKLDLQTWLKDAQLPEGNMTEARVVVTNNSDKDAPTPIAIVGIPGGLEVRHDQLKELVKAGKIDAYEVLGREVVLYWRQFKAGAKADLSLSLTAAIPGTYTAPASRAYLYYTDEYKQWIQGTTVTITPK